MLSSKLQTGPDMYWLKQWDTSGTAGSESMVARCVTYDCPPCYSLPHRLSSMLFSPSHTVLHVILSLTDCCPCYSLPHRLSSMLFSPSQTVLHTVLHVIHSLTDCPPCYSLPHRLSSMLFSPSQTVLHRRILAVRNDNGVHWMKMKSEDEGRQLETSP
ncbi:unnamed protein product, partial [Ranitomeya imitator]